MLMHQNNKSELEFGKESLGISSDFSSPNLPPPPSSPPSSSSSATATTLSLLSPNTNIEAQSIDPQIQTTNTTPNQSHFSIQVSSSPICSSSSSQHHHPPNQSQQSNSTHPCNHHHHHHEHEQQQECIIFPNNNDIPSAASSSSPSQTPISSPHKRPIMNNHPVSSSPSPLSPHSHPRHNHAQDSPFQTPSGTKFQPLKLLTQPQFRFLIFLSLPSLYFLLSNPPRSLPLDLFFVITFSALLLFSLNLALPRLPSIRLFLARSLPKKLSSSFSTTNSHQQPVLWSIGSKPNNNKNLKAPSSGFYVQVYSNGDVYEGEFHKGKCSGSGVYHYHMSGRYEGDWVDGRYDGFGVETWARGSRYRGQYRQGLRHGVGIYRFFSGDVYAGEWSNGQCHGFGVHTCSDGSHYVGEFKWGVKHGFGQYHFRNGDIYAGEYFADMMHGFGVYKFQNGHQYEGAWHEGRRQGLGKYTFRNGEAQCGHWQNGILDDPKMQNSQVGSPCAVDHAKVFNAVKDAQCAAEKAYNLGKVDVGVNQVVASANKAANAARVAAVKAVQSRVHHNNNDK